MCLTSWASCWPGILPCSYTDLSGDGCKFQIASKDGAPIDFTLAVGLKMCENSDVTFISVITKVCPSMSLYVSLYVQCDPNHAQKPHCTNSLGSNTCFCMCIQNHARTHAHAHARARTHTHTHARTYTHRAHLQTTSSNHAATVLAGCSAKTSQMKSTQRPLVMSLNSTLNVNPEQKMIAAVARSCLAQPT